MPEARKSESGALVLAQTPSGWNARISLAGGFRTRYRVQWVRGIYQLVVTLPATIRAALADIFGAQQHEDRQRRCPHSDEVRDLNSLLGPGDRRADYWYCRDCAREWRA